MFVLQNRDFSRLQRALWDTTYEYLSSAQNILHEKSHKDAQGCSQHLGWKLTLIPSYTLCSHHIDALILKSYMVSPTRTGFGQNSFFLSVSIVQNQDTTAADATWAPKDSSHPKELAINGDKNQMQERYWRKKTWRQYNMVKVFLKLSFL